MIIDESSAQRWHGRKGDGCEAVQSSEGGVVERQHDLKPVVTVRQSVHGDGVECWESFRIGGAKGWNDWLTGRLS